MSQPAQGTIHTPPQLDDLLAHSSRTFALTIPLLPEPTRCEVTVAYLLFRVADTLEDSDLWPRARKLEQLERFAAFLDGRSDETATGLSNRWREDPPCDHAGYRALLEQLPAVMRVAAEISPQAMRHIIGHTRRTIAGMSRFVAREIDGVLELRDLGDLKDYCYAVAGIVGEMLTELFLLHGEGLAVVAPALRADAATFGEALQLVNVLKDSATDRREGRNFLPSGVARADVFALARQDLRIAGRYCAVLEGAGAARGLVAFNALPTLLAWGTLERVEQRGPGSKLTRDELAGLIERLNDALDRKDVSSLWGDAGKL